MKADIVKLRLGHLEPLARRICAADVKEVADMSAMAVFSALRLSLLVSHESWAGTIDGHPVCAFGLGIGCNLAETAMPWLLTTDAMRLHAPAFLRRNRQMVARWSAEWRVLENYVSAENGRAIKWLGWLGFEIQPAAPYGPFGKPFHRFTMIRRRDNNQEWN